MLRVTVTKQSSSGAQHRVSPCTLQGLAGAQDILQSSNIIPPLRKGRVFFVLFRFFPFYPKRHYRPKKAIPEIIKYNEIQKAMLVIPVV